MVWIGIVLNSRTPLAVLERGPVARMRLAIQVFRLQSYRSCLRRSGKGKCNSPPSENHPRKKNSVAERVGPIATQELINCLISSRTSRCHACIAEPVPEPSAHGCVNKGIDAGVKESEEVDAKHGEEEILSFHEVLSLVLRHDADQEGWPTHGSRAACGPPCIVLRPDRFITTPQQWSSNCVPRNYGVPPSINTSSMSHNEEIEKK
ncbi:hypothetical protein TNCV_190341 [Trichonephila clavipes]|nr:hypothetical protein TNCV_190341 [Trichonephila clavipes]